MKRHQPPTAQQPGTRSSLLRPRHSQDKGGFSLQEGAADTHTHTPRYPVLWAINSTAMWEGFGAASAAPGPAGLGVRCSRSPGAPGHRRCPEQQLPASLCSRTAEAASSASRPCAPALPQARPPAPRRVQPASHHPQDTDPRNGLG